MKQMAWPREDLYPNWNQHPEKKKHCPKDSRWFESASDMGCWFFQSLNIWDQESRTKWECFLHCYTRFLTHKIFIFFLHQALLPLVPTEACLYQVKALVSFNWKWRLLPAILSFICYWICCRVSWHVTYILV